MSLISFTSDFSHWPLRISFYVLLHYWHSVMIFNWISELKQVNLENEGYHSITAITPCTRECSKMCVCVCVASSQQVCDVGTLLGHYGQENRGSKRLRTNLTLLVQVELRFKSVPFDTSLRCEHFPPFHCLSLLQILSPFLTVQIPWPTSTFSSHKEPHSSGCLIHMTLWTKPQPGEILFTVSSTSTLEWLKGLDECTQPGSWATFFIYDQNLQEDT
jgi:hypothetical protein